MSLNLQHITIGIAGVIGGAVVNQHWSTAIRPGIEGVWTGICTFAAQRPELAIGIPAAIGVVCAIYKLCGSYLVQKLTPIAPKGPEIGNPLPTLKGNFDTLVKNTILLCGLKDKLSLALNQVTEVDLHRKLKILIEEVKIYPSTSLEVRLCSAKEEKTEKNVREKLTQVLGELSDINTDLAKSLAKDGRFFVENSFQTGKEDVVFIVNISADPTIAGYYKLSQGADIHPNDISYDYQLQSSGGISYTMFDRTGAPYMNKVGQVATLSRNVVFSKELGASSLEPKKKPGTVQGLKKGDPLPEEKVHIRDTSSIRNFFRRFSLSHLLVQNLPEPSAIGGAFLPVIEEEPELNPQTEVSKPAPTQKAKKTGLVQNLRRLFTQSGK